MKERKETSWTWKRIVLTKGRANIIASSAAIVDIVIVIVVVVS